MAATNSGFSGQYQQTVYVEFSEFLSYSLLYWCSKMEFIDSSKDRKRLWFVSFASKKDGEDIELNSCINFVLVVELSPSR